VRHLTVQQISGSLDGALSGVSLELVVRHLSSCHECRERHARLTKQDDALRRLLVCEVSEVFLDDMFARLGVVLEAEAHGQIPPEHALPPELPPLAPEPPPSREIPRPPSVTMPIPALPTEAEQKRRAEAELKAAEAAALSSLEELLRDLNAKKVSTGPVAAALPATAVTPAVPAPPAATTVPATPALPETPEPPATSEPPRSILVLPPDVILSLRDAGTGRAQHERAPEPEPVAAEPESQAPEPAPVSQDGPAVTGVEETSLHWVVVEGPLPTGPDAEFAGWEEADAGPHLDIEPLGEIECETVPEGVYVIDSEPEPVPVPEPTPAPEPEPVYAIEPEPAPVRTPAPEPERVYAIEPEPEPVRTPAPLREPEPVFAVAPGPRPVAPPAPGRGPAPRGRSGPAAPAPPNARPRVLDATPESDPYADYETRLEAERRALATARPRGPSRRHLAGAAAGVLALLVALASIGYLPPVIRVPLPVFPAPHLPRFEVVQVPLASGPQAKRVAQPSATQHERAGETDTQVATTRPAPPRVVPEPVTEHPEAPRPRVVSEPVTEHPEAPRPRVETASAPEPAIRREPVEPVRAQASEPAQPVASQPAPAAPSGTGTTARTATLPAPAATNAGSNEQADDGASWPLLCGVVLDDTGSPVAGARVALADLDLGARTDRRGHFCVAAPPGDRTLSVVAAGFATHRRIVSLGAQGLELSIALTQAP
jgi:hypothetical protein